MWLLTGCILVLLAISLSWAQTMPNEDWGYVNVDSVNNANIFWWFYGSNNGKDRATSPLIIWLQGGPGASSMYGNFCEIGPVNGCVSPTQPRNATWANVANLMFIDQPVGTGWSYVRNKNGYVHNEDQISQELITVLSAFYAKYPAATKMPLWIFGESYGGKMGVHFGAALLDAIKAGTISANFKGVGIGDSWISGEECMKSYGSFLQSVSLIDDAQAAILDSYGDKASAALQTGEYNLATQLWGNQQSSMEGFTGGVNVYDFLSFQQENDAVLTKFMNGPVRAKLGIIPSDITWSMESGAVFNELSADFMQSAVPQVDKLLAAGISVVIYNGQLDVIVNTLCVEAWVSTLQWSGLPKWNSAVRHIIREGPLLKSVPRGYRKTYANLDFWWILDAGHMVPADNPSMALRMIQETVGKQV